MAITFANILSMVQSKVGDRGASGTTELTRAINLGQRKVAGEFEWPKLRARAFKTTMAPYTTGTITLTKDSATVTGSGTDFTGLAGRKLALAHNQPWFEIAMITNGTELELSEAWPFETVTASGFVIYEDRVEMPSDFQRLRRMWLHDTRRRMPLDQFPQDANLPGGPGTPFQYDLIERTSGGSHRFQLGPCVPDAVYRVEVSYQKEVTDDTFSFDDEQAELLVWAALSYAYERDQSAERRERADRKYVEELQRVMARASEDPTDFDLGEMGARRRSSPLAYGDGWDVVL